MTALQVVKDSGVEDFTQLGSCDANRCGPNEATDQCAGNTAQRSTCRASDQTDRHAESATGEGSAHAGKATSDRTDCTASLTTDISGRNEG